MWKSVWGSVPGTSHRRVGKPCQDYCNSLTVETSDGPVLVVACADGAGSAELSDVGAHLAVETFLAAAGDALARGDGTTASDQDVLFGWNEAARRRLEAEADLRGVELRQFACTLLTAIVGPAQAAFTQVGDGAIIFSRVDDYQFVFWPSSGEYANTTHFVTDKYYGRNLRFDCLDAPPDDLAVLTDGLQALALNFAEGRVHRQFFRPMFDTLRRAPSGSDLKYSLEAFLDSERVNDRTDDDKTLFLATRMPASSEP